MHAYLSAGKGVEVTRAIEKNQFRSGDCDYTVLNKRLVPGENLGFLARRAPDPPLNAKAAVVHSTAIC